MPTRPPEPIAASEAAAEAAVEGLHGNGTALVWLRCRLSFHFLVDQRAHPRRG
jgi:hypothetical protein